MLRIIRFRLKTASNAKTERLFVYRSLNLIGGHVIRLWTKKKTEPKFDHLSSLSCRRIKKKPLKQQGRTGLSVKKKIAQAEIKTKSSVCVLSLIWFFLDQKSSDLLEKLKFLKTKTRAGCSRDLPAIKRHATIYKIFAQTLTFPRTRINLFGGKSWRFSRSGYRQEFSVFATLPAHISLNVIESELEPDKKTIQSRRPRNEVADLCEEHKNTQWLFL